VAGSVGEECVVGRLGTDCIAAAAVAVAGDDAAATGPEEERDIGCWDIVVAACAAPSESRAATGSNGALHADVEEVSGDRRLSVEVVAAVGVAAVVVQHTGPTRIFAGVAEAGSCLADCPRVDSTSDLARHRC
jgi:hypothetical protein